jgi:hypothetical protein
MFKQQSPGVYIFQEMEITLPKIYSAQFGLIKMSLAFNSLAVFLVLALIVIHTDYAQGKISTPSSFLVASSHSNPHVINLKIRGGSSVTNVGHSSRHIIALEPDELVRTRVDRVLKGSVGHQTISFGSAFTTGVHFALMIWRLYTEIANCEESDGMISYIAMATMYLLQALNVAGFAANILDGAKYKTLLKRIVVLNMMREFVELLYNIFSFISPLASYQREHAIGSIFTSLWILAAHVAVIRSTWAAGSPVKLRYNKI